MEVNAGYKQTELGIIPEDWDVVPISLLLEKGTRITYGVVQPGPNVDNGVLFIRGGDIFGGKIDIENLRKISPSISNSYKRTLLQGGEILISLVGYPGEAAIVPDSLAGANIARQAALVRISKDKLISTEYVCDFLLSDMGKRLLLNETFGSAQQVINLKDINKLVIILPRQKAEQEFIAEALSDVDALIEALEQLIAKKRQVKEGALQELLSGKRRLPGFGGEWKETKLGDIAEITKLAGFEYSKYFNSYKDRGDIIVIRGTNITNNRLDLTDIKTIPQSTSNFLQRSKLQKGDLVFAYVGTIGPVYLITESNKYHLGPNTARITVKGDNSPNFVFWYFCSNLAKKEIDERISVGAQPSLSMTKIRNFKIALPTHSEQTAIAEILSDMDAEIAALEGKLSKARQVKQGMMSVLLSGKIRLVGSGNRE